MTVESWITPEETPALAAAATAAIEAHLSRFSLGERAAFWASIRKAYNTPYNDPVRRPKAALPTQPSVGIALDDGLAAALPIAAIAAAALPIEAQAA